MICICLKISFLRQIMKIQIKTLRNFQNNHVSKFQKLNFFKFCKMSLAFAKGYCDLNIPIDSDVSPLNLVKRAISFGYETLALNIRVHQKELIRKKSLQKHEAKKVKVCVAGI